MKNPFEIIIERLEQIEIAIQQLNAPRENDDEILLSRLETPKLLKINLTSLWKQKKVVNYASILHRRSAVSSVRSFYLY